VTPQWLSPGFPVPTHILREVTEDGRVALWCGGVYRSTAVLGHPLTWRYGYCHQCYRAWLEPWTREQLSLGGFE
jgi:hypothetical protein